MAFAKTQTGSLLINIFILFFNTTFALLLLHLLSSYSPVMLLRCTCKYILIYICIYIYYSILYIYTYNIYIYIYIIYKIELICMYRCACIDNNPLI